MGEMAPKNEGFTWVPMVGNVGNANKRVANLVAIEDWCDFKFPLFIAALHMVFSWITTFVSDLVIDMWIVMLKNHGMI